MKPKKERKPHCFPLIDCQVKRIFKSLPKVLIRRDVPSFVENAQRKPKRQKLQTFLQSTLIQAFRSSSKLTLKQGRAISFCPFRLTSRLLLPITFYERIFKSAWTHFHSVIMWKYWEEQRFWLLVQKYWCLLRFSSRTTISRISQFTYLYR